jgi:hypothetical protein
VAQDIALSQIRLINFYQILPQDEVKMVDLATTHHQRTPFFLDAGRIAF